MLHARFPRRRSKMLGASLNDREIYSDSYAHQFFQVWCIVRKGVQEELL